MLLLGLFLVGCKRLEYPQPEALQNATIEKIKAWYNPKIERLKGAKSTGVDIYYPQWEQGLIHNLPNGERIAVFPVHRQKNVRYHEVGFVRRLVVKLDLQDSISQAKLIEMIGQKSYLRTNKDLLARRYVQHDTIGLYDHAIVWENPLSFEIDKTLPNPCETEISATITNAEDNSGCYLVMNFACGGSSVKKKYKTMCDNWSGVGLIPGSGSVPGGGGSGGSPNDSIPVYTEEPPCTTCPATGFTTDPGDNTNLPDEPPVIDVSPELDAIWDKVPNLTYVDENLISKEKAMKMIDSVLLEGIKENPILKRMYDSLKVDFKFNFEVYSDNKNGSYYRTYNFNRLERFIFLDARLFLRPNFKKKLKLTLFEEMFHAYQDRFYGASVFDNLIQNHMINIECEQRFFIEYIEYTTTINLDEGGIFKSKDTDVFAQSHKFFQNKFRAIMQTVKETGGPKPSNMGTGSKYFTEFIEDLFRKEYKDTRYTANPTNFNQLPIALFSMF